MCISNQYRRVIKSMEKKIFTQISSDNGLRKLNKPGFSGFGNLKSIAIPKLRNGLVKSICFSRA
jgi:hypothetical protein